MIHGTPTTLTRRNAGAMLPEVLRSLQYSNVQSDSRNGPVLAFPGPVTLTYMNPLERVVFIPERDANPFFHLFESLWMLAGRNDVEYPASFVSSMADFSDDGETFNGAYGYRWMHQFGFNQVVAICQALIENPDCRRQVLSMWDGHHDPLSAQEGTKDVPCNTHAYFRIIEGALHMTVCNRSNDIIWGALGANVVHFSVLQEVMATLIGCEVGTYSQISNNMHFYSERHGKMAWVIATEYSQEISKFPRHDPYGSGQVRPEPLFHHTECDSPDSKLNILQEFVDFVDEGMLPGMKSRFLRRVAGPMLQAYRVFQDKEDKRRVDNALALLDGCDGNIDWIAASRQWLERRRKPNAAKS